MFDVLYLWLAVVVLFVGIVALLLVTRWVVNSVGMVASY